MSEAATVHSSPLIWTHFSTTSFYKGRLKLSENTSAVPNNNLWIPYIQDEIKNISFGFQSVHILKGHDPDTFYFKLKTKFGNLLKCIKLQNNVAPNILIQKHNIIKFSNYLWYFFLFGQSVIIIKLKFTIF